MWNCRFVIRGTGDTDIPSPAVHFCSIDRVKRQYILTAVVRGRKQQLFLKTKAVPHTVGVEKRFAAGIEAASVTLSSISPCGVLASLVLTIALAGTGSTGHTFRKHFFKFCFSYRNIGLSQLQLSRKTQYLLLTLRLSMTNAEVRSVSKTDQNSRP